MKALSQFLDRIANSKLLFLLLIIYAIFPSYILKNAVKKINQLAGKTIGVIDLTVGFNPQKTLQMVADYGDEALDYISNPKVSPPKKIKNVGILVNLKLKYSVRR